MSLRPFFTRFYIPILIVVALCVFATVVFIKVRPHTTVENGDVASQVQLWQGPLYLVDGNSAHVGTSNWHAVFSAPPRVTGQGDYRDENYSDYEQVTLLNVKNAGQPNAETYNIHFHGGDLFTEIACVEDSCKPIAKSKLGPVLQGPSTKSLFVVLPNGYLEVDPSNADIDSLAVINSLQPVSKKTFADTIVKLPFS